jgi:hypothetical protein
MRMNKCLNAALRFTRQVLNLCLLVLVVAVPALRAKGEDEFDSYKIRFEGFWVFSDPSGSFKGSSADSTIDLKKDLNFKSSSTFAGKVDWKLSHKNHIYFVFVPYSKSSETILTRTIVYEGKTFQVGLNSKSRLELPMYGIGYQYDVIRRKRGHLGIAVQANIFDTSASIDAAAQVTGDGVGHAAISASKSLLAPLPVEFFHQTRNEGRSARSGSGVRFKKCHGK